MHAPVAPNPLVSGPIVPTLARLSLPNMISMLAVADLGAGPDVSIERLRP